jgi:16S rRNA G966 N2-methylase RsmD
MDNNIKKKIFPPISNYENLQYDDVGLYSITHPNDADLISKIIFGEIGYNSILMDCTAGIGGNSISFCKYFQKVISIELDYDRFIMLKNNLDTFNFENFVSINDNFLNHINSKVSGYYFDPPWGGPDYKNNENINIQICNFTLYHIVKKIRENNQAPIFFKLPNNYNLKEFSEFNYMINKIKNYLIITII